MTRKDITYNDKIGELRLDIAHPNRKDVVFILVEGESDIKFYRKLFNQNCRVERIPGGNPKVEDAVEELVKKHSKLIGVRDADFIHLNGLGYSKENIFLTDFHDMEISMVLEDDCLNAILYEYSDEKNDKFSLIRASIFQIIEQISLLKWLNEKENLELKFKSTHFQDIISISDSKIDFEQYFSRLLGKSPMAKIKDFEIILSKINELKTQNPDIYQLSNGHDFLNAFAYFLNSNNKHGMRDDIFASMLRVKYSVEDFHKTKLYATISIWAEELNCTV